MTVRSFVPRAGHLPYWAIGLSMFAALAGILPIAVALFGGVGGGTQTAFATAPPGTYIVYSATDGTSDTIFVAPAEDPANATEIAVVDHLDGYSPRGAVSPDGKKVALTVAEAGTVAHPGASVLVVDLESGEVTRVAIDVDVLQTPAWAPDSASVIFTRSVTPEGALATVTIHRVAIDGSNETEIGRHDGVLGAYLVGFDPQGRLVTVVIDGNGSTVYRDGQELRNISAEITRDWELSPDGTQLAFIETDLTDGLRYRARVVALDGNDPDFAAQAFDDDSQQLGVAWNPAAGPTFGNEPSSNSGGVSAQGAASGFDIPLSYSPDGSALVVQAWSGSSFESAGKMRHEIVRGGERLEVPATRIFGWSVK